MLDHEIESNRQRQERRRAIWSDLETTGALPDPFDPEHFSNLLQEDIDRAEKLWPRLSTELRRDLVQTLSAAANADIVMDFTAIFRIAIHDSDAGIREIAVDSLYEVEDVRLVPAFIDILRRDPAPRVRATAARVLANFVLLGELEKIRPGPFEAAVVALSERYADSAEDLEVRRHAMESLSYTGEHQVPAMISDAYAHEDDGMRESAVVAMGRSADKRWGNNVARELQNPSPAMRLAATRAAGELQLRTVARELVELTEDTDTRIQAAALWSLGQIGGNLARKTLQRYENADDEVLSEIAEQALQELEFFYGDLSTFFGPPSEYDGETDERWRMPVLGDLPEDEADLYFVDDDEFEDEDDDEELTDEFSMFETPDDDDEDEDW